MFVRTKKSITFGVGSFGNLAPMSFVVWAYSKVTTHHAIAAVFEPFPMNRIRAFRFLPMPRVTLFILFPSLPRPRPILFLPQAHFSQLISFQQVYF